MTCGRLAVVAVAGLALGLVPGIRTVEASLPARSGLIAFTSDRDGNDEIYVMRADGTAQTNLTHHAARDIFPAWSPDGRRIAFSSDRDGNWEIYVMNADGTGQTNITHDAAFELYPAWSPDGTKIAYQHDPGPDAAVRDEEVYVMNADGSGRTDLSNSPGYDRYPAWSPDGTRIAFHTGRDGNSEIYVMAADGGDQANVSQHVGDDSMADWSPDGTRLAFTSDRVSVNGDDNYDVFVMKADGTGQTDLTNTLLADYQGDWSPDGTRITFTSEREQDWEVFTMNADGTGQVDVSDNHVGGQAGDRDPDWQPDPAAPVAAPSAAPAANAAGWNTTPVTVTWHWSDAESGLDAAACTSSTTSAGWGDSVTVGAACTDVAGNVGHATYTLRIDVEPPVAAPTVSPAANAAGWNTTPVTVTWHWSDALSGLGLTCTPSTTSAGSGDPVTVSAECTDVAGNVGRATYAVRIDATPPSAVMTAPTAIFTATQSIRLAWTAGDALSGVTTNQLRWARGIAPGGAMSAWSTPAAWTSLTVRALRTTAAPGYRYCYAVRARDVAGSTGTWSAARCITVPRDDRSLRASPGWTRGTSSRFIAGTFVATTVRGASLVTPTAVAVRQVGVVATRCPRCGVVAVFVGRAKVGTISLTRATPLVRGLLVLPAFATTCTGVVRLVVVSSGRTVRIDALALARA